MNNRTKLAIGVVVVILLALVALPYIVKTIDGFKAKTSEHQIRISES